MKIIENMLLLPRSRAFLPLITVWLEVRSPVAETKREKPALAGLT
jgi:hypothetical protein